MSTPPHPHPPAPPPPAAKPLARPRRWLFSRNFWLYVLATAVPLAIFDPFSISTRQRSWIAERIPPEGEGATAGWTARRPPKELLAGGKAPPPDAEDIPPPSPAGTQTPAAEAKTAQKEQKDR